MACILYVFGRCTSATRDTRLMCVIEDPVIPDTDASLLVFHPSVILVSFKGSVTQSQSNNRKNTEPLHFGTLGIKKPFNSLVYQGIGSEIDTINHA